jgi:hypothetical protein
LKEIGVCLKNRYFEGENMENAQEHQYVSSYGLMISKNILARLGLMVSAEELLAQLKSPDLVYARLCHLPMMHIYNQLIFAQIQSYQTFIQKRLIDYYIQSNQSRDEASSESEAQHPDAITLLKDEFLTLKEQTKVLEQQLLDMITNSQRYLIQMVQLETMQFGGSFKHFPKDYDERIEAFKLSVSTIRKELIAHRADWRAFSITVSERLSQFGYVTPDVADDLEQRVELDFIPNLGESVS